MGMQRQGRAPATINRTLATLKHFARRAHELAAVFGTKGLPTTGVRTLSLGPLPCRKLSPTAVRVLFAAAQAAVAAADVATLTRAKNGRRPRRNLALLAFVTRACGLPSL